MSSFVIFYSPIASCIFDMYYGIPIFVQFALKLAFFPAMAVFDPGRSTAYKEFQVPTLAVVIEFSKCRTVAFDWHTSSKQSYGIVVLDAFFDAPCF